ncbi:MAG: beta-lactamase family protein [Devosiaceae bacterium]|nr:beta-lactamase family protein [Devosiaceae bacterium]
MSIQFFSSSINDDYLKKLSRKAIRNFGLPAVAVATMNSREIQAAHLLGNRVFQEDEPATINDFFHIGSCSKSLLAMIAGRLVDEGKLQWETRFFDLFPELKNQSRNEYYDISLEDLFLCEAGILAFTSHEEELPELDDNSASRTSQFVEFLLKQPPAKPRKNNGKFDHLYSNAGYTIISQMLEKTTGKSYLQMIAELAKKLGIKIHHGWPNSLGADQPWGHMIANNKTVKLGPDHEYKLPDLIAPAGDLAMTPPDFSEYIRQNLAGLTGQDGYLKPKTFQKIHFGYQGFSLGVANGTLHRVNLSVINGSAGTFFCQAIIVPKSDFALTIMSNAGTGAAQMPAIEWVTEKIMARKFNWWWKALT